MYNKNIVFTIRPSQPALTRQDILAMLEVLWHDKDVVNFKELIPMNTYTREDAATAFEILLGKYYYIHNVYY